MSNLLTSRTLLSLILIGYAIAAGLLIPVAADDIRMVDVFSVDEAGGAIELKHLLNNGLGVGLSFKYGSLFYYIPYLLITPFGAVSESTIVLVYRTICAGFGMGCLLLTYHLGRVFVGRRAGLIGAALLALTPIFLRWGVTIHPDLPQLFWILLALYLVCRLGLRFGLKDLMGASICAALAFNTKYGGVFLLPIISFAALMPSDPVGNVRLALDWRNPERIGGLALAFCAFMGTFALTNPYAILDFEGFRGSLEAERQVMAFGHTVQGDRSLVEWLTLLYALLGPANALILCVSGIYVVYRARDVRTVRRETVLLLTWVILLLAYLSIFSSLKRPRHLLPILPVLLLTVGYAYVFVWDRVGKLTARWSIVALGIVGGWPLVTDTAAFFVARSERGRSSSEIEAGRWIGQHYPPATRILYSSYAYVPSEFDDAFRLFELTYPIVNHFKPDLLVVRDAAGAEYADTARARVSRTGYRAFMDTHFFHKFEAQGRFEDYPLVRSFGDVRVYSRRGDVEGRESSYLALVQEYAAGKLRGVGEAYDVLEALHLADGDTSRALELRQRISRVENRAARIYRDGVAYLKTGQLDEAKGLLEDVTALVRNDPDSLRAVVRQRNRKVILRVQLF